jgi:hypothetical protein
LPEQPGSTGLRSKTTRERGPGFHHTAKFADASIYAGQVVGQAVISATSPDFARDFQIAKKTAALKISSAQILCISQLRPFFRRCKK